MTARLERTEWKAVGTTCLAAATAGPSDGRRARAALAAGRAEVAACERELSRFDPDSDLSRLNAAAGAWAPVGPRLLEALALALRARTETGGLFDPTILPVLAAAGYDRSFELVSERPARRVAGWRAGAAIELDETTGRARLQPGAAVDLGGVGKGYAAGRALDAMWDAWPALPGGLVALGGDVAVRGATPEGREWRIRVADPRRSYAALGVLALEQGGVATSGRDVRRFGPNRSLHHLIDPSTGASAVSGPLAVTVVAPGPAEAEIHATALGISELDAAAAHVAARPWLSALYVPASGEPVPLGPLPLARARVLLRAA